MTGTASATGAGRPPSRGVLLASAAGASVLAAAAAAGLVLGPGSNRVVGGVLEASTRSSNLLGDLGSLLGFGFAFGAGMVAAVNPCGFVMLPAYLGLYVGAQEGPTAGSAARRLGRAFVVSGTVGLGCVVLFGGTGLAVSAGARSLGAAFPWVGLVLGVALVLAGTYVLGGGRLYVAFAARTAGLIGSPTDMSPRGYFLFGLSYAVASLSCAMPVFLALATGSLASGGLLHAVAQFLLYAAGMSFVVLALTLGIALARGAVSAGARRLLSYAAPASGALLLAAGGYIVFYWLTEEGVAR